MVHIHLSHGGKRLNLPMVNVTLFSFLFIATKHSAREFITIYHIIYFKQHFKRSFSLLSLLFNCYKHRIRLNDKLILDQSLCLSVKHSIEKKKKNQLKLE